MLQELILLNNYSYYLALRKTNLQRAEELILIVLSKFPNIATYCDTYGWVLFQMGKYSLSEKEIEEGIIHMIEKERVLVEGAAGTSVAALIKMREQLKGKRVGIIVCGKNISLDVLKRIL